MNGCDEKLKKALLEVWEKEDARLEEEMKHCEPHVFSQEFEQKMDELLNAQGRDKAPYGFRRRLTPFLKVVAVIVAICVVAGGALFLQRGNLQASSLKIDILEWLDKFFTVEDGNGRRTTEQVLFEESQIGYLPDGFEKVSEENAFSQVQYKFKNKEGECITLQVYKGKMLSTVDNESAEQKVYVNEAGYEYTMIYREDGDRITVLWKDEQDLYYYMESSLHEDEILKIMNSISYTGRK